MSQEPWIDSIHSGGWTNSQATKPLKKGQLIIPKKHHEVLTLSMASKLGKRHQTAQTFANLHQSWMHKQNQTRAQLTSMGWAEKQSNFRHNSLCWYLSFTASWLLRVSYQAINRTTPDPVLHGPKMSDRCIFFPTFFWVCYLVFLSRCCGWKLLYKLKRIVWMCSSHQVCDHPILLLHIQVSPPRGLPSPAIPLLSFLGGGKSLFPFSKGFSLCKPFVLRGLCHTFILDNLNDFVRGLGVLRAGRDGSTSGELRHDVKLGKMEKAWQFQKKKLYSFALPFMNDLFLCKHFGWGVVAQMSRKKPSKTQEPSV